MSVLLQISDTHFGTEQPPVLAALRQLHAEQRPDLLIVSGDITQRARRSQFRAAHEFLTGLATPMVIVPGNHDIPLFNLALRFFAPYANYIHAFGENLQPEFSSPDLLVLGVNTTRPQRHTDGEVSAQQLETVSARLRHASPLQLRVVVTHQPVHVVTESDQSNLLHGYRDAIRAWAQAGADLIVGGHIHLPYVRPLHESYNEIARAVWAVQAGTALSSRVRGDVPNSVNIIRYESIGERRECSVEQWNFDFLSAQFRLKLRTEIALAQNA